MSVRSKVVHILPVIESLKLTGRFEEARAAYQRDIQTRFRVLGADHIQVALTRLCLAELYKEQISYFEDSKSEFEMCLKILRNRLGESHLGIS